MKIGEIIEDSLRYPFTDWKKILILGIIILSSNIIGGIANVLNSNFEILILLFIDFFMISLLERGYQLRIIKSSLASNEELPNFNKWGGMFIDGIKVFIVGIAYFIPAILMIIFFPNSLTLILKIILANYPSYVINLLLSVSVSLLGVPVVNDFLAGSVIQVFILLIY